MSSRQLQLFVPGYQLATAVALVTKARDQAAILTGSACRRPPDADDPPAFSARSPHPLRLISLNDTCSTVSGSLATP
jgi:hypothetical protein